MIKFGLSLLVALVSSGLTAASPVEARQDYVYPYSQVQFINQWPDQFCYNVGYLIGWEGGSEYYGLNLILNYPGLIDTDPGQLEHNTTQHSYLWNAPAQNETETGATYQFVIEDSNVPLNDSPKRLEQGPVIPIVQC